MPQESKNDSGSHIKETTSIKASTKNTFNQKDLTRLSVMKNETDLINEVPTKDQVNSQKIKHKRRPFSHVINGT